jgi:hypothetical protein
MGIKIYVYIIIVIMMVYLIIAGIIILMVLGKDIILSYLVKPDTDTTQNTLNSNLEGTYILGKNYKKVVKLSIRKNAIGMYMVISDAERLRGKIITAIENKNNSNNIDITLSNSVTVPFIRGSVINGTFSPGTYNNDTIYYESDPNINEGLKLEKISNFTM